MASGTVAIFAVVHQADSVSGFGIIRPLMGNSFKFRHIPAGVFVSRTFHISVLDIKSCLAGADIQREKDPQKLLMLMPVCMGDKVDPAVVVIKTDFLRNRGILIIPIHFYFCHQRRFFHRNRFQIIYLVSFFLVIDINIPGIILHRTVLINYQVVPQFACLQDLAVIFLIKNRSHTAFFIPDNMIKRRVHFPSPLFCTKTFRLGSNFISQGCKSDRLYVRNFYKPAILRIYSRQLFSICGKPASLSALVSFYFYCYNTFAFKTTVIYYSYNGI